MVDSTTDTNIAPQSNATEYTVSEISGALKRTVEDRFGHVRIRGEITGYRGPHSSGHSYFALKDERARIEAVIWRGVASKLKHLPEEGLEVIATGKLTTYPGSSKYQIVIDGLEPAGAGALMALLEERKKKLEAEGLFAEERKQLLPHMPKSIGVVTSPTGAVIRDVLHRLSDRFPLHVIVWPVRVQGDTSGTEVANAVNGFNRISPNTGLPKPDLIIVARGGGSIEDLWGFNDEDAVRAVANSEIPVISAVGHETDWTLIDLAADVRAPTPTGAAEFAVPVKAELEATIASLSARLKTATSRTIENHTTNLRAASRGLATPDTLLALPRRRFDEAAGRLERGLSLVTQKKRSDMQKIIGRGIATPRQLFHLPATRLNDASKGLTRSFRTIVQQERSSYNLVTKRLDPALLAKVQSASGEKLQALANRRVAAHRANMEKLKARLEQAGRLIESLSHKRILDRGYAVIRDAGNIPVMSASNLATGDGFSVQMNDGEFSAVVQSGKPKKSKSPAKTKKKSEPNQGNLF